MKKFKLFLFVAIAALTFSSCSKVPAGYVGIKFYLLGGDKGVDQEELSPGRYYIGINEELYKFPTFTQNYSWTADEAEGSPNDESFNFQDIQGLELNADIGITYKIRPEKVSTIFEKYKRGIEEITDVFLRNMVRDALVKQTSTMQVEDIYGAGRADLIDRITQDVREQCDSLGIDVEKIYWIGRIKLPPSVKEAVDNKIKATQKAQEVENQIREATAQAQKVIEKARGDSTARVMLATAEAAANRLVNASLTDRLIRYNEVQKWDGALSKVSGGSGTLVDLRQE